MPTEKLVKRILTTQPPEDPRDDAAPRRSDPDFTWLLAESSIPVSLGENLWNL